MLQSSRPFSMLLTIQVDDDGNLMPIMMLHMSSQNYQFCQWSWVSPRSLSLIPYNLRFRLYNWLTGWTETQLVETFIGPDLNPRYRSYWPGAFVGQTQGLSLALLACLDPDSNINVRLELDSSWKGTKTDIPPWVLLGGWASRDSVRWGPLCKCIC